MTTDDRACLNCRAELSGPFCAQCGQRAIPAYPTVKEMAGDAWNELSGVDGRLARTLAALLAWPGKLTVETLRGRRASYIKPLRLYLSASVLYFVLAAAAPDTTERNVVIPGDVAAKVTVMGRDTMMTEAQRTEALANAQRAPALMRPLFVTLIEDPAGFRSRVLAAFPKMVFALVPVLALILGLFYRGRRYMQHLVFALHTNAALFLALIPAQLLKFTRIDLLAAIAGAIAMVFIVWYVIRAQRVVYGDGLVLTIAKSAGLLVLYGLVSAPAMILLLAWAAYFR